MKCLAAGSRFGSGLCSRMQKRLMRTSKWARINYRWSATNVRCETMRKKFLSARLIVFVIVAAILFGCSGKIPNPEDVVEGAQSTDFSLTALEGATFQKNSLTGNVVYLTFWA